MTFEPGKSGNPGGRPKTKPFAEALRMELAEAGADHKALRGIARRLIDKANEGDLAAIVELANRTDGKPAQQLNLADADGEKLIVQLVRFGDDTPAE